MDKNTITGFILMLALLLGYNWYYSPTEEEIAAAKAAEVALAEEEALNSLDNIIYEQPPITQEIDSIEYSLELRNEFGAFSNAATGSENIETISSEKLQLEFSSKGAMPISAILIDGSKKYGGNENVEIWDPKHSKINIQFDIKGLGRINTQDLYFNITDKSPYSITYTASATNGGSLVIIHSIEDYRLHTNVAFEGMQGIVEERQLLDWTAAGLRNEKGLQWERQHTSIFYKEDDRGRNYLSEGRSDDEKLETELEWMAFKQNFFSALVSTPDGFSVGSILENTLVEGDTVNTLFFHANLPMDARVSGSKMEKRLDFYFGPNSLNDLNTTELDEVGRIIDYGWWIFGWVNRNAILPIYDFFYSRVASAGLIILIITLIIKMFLFPITWKNFLSSAKMKVLRPDIEQINEKHKDDAMARQQATVELYRKTGVNPMAGCLPALLQMPILYAMFRFFPANIDLRGQSFLWADDLASYDSIIDLPFTIPMYGSHISGLTVLMAASIFVYMKMTTAGQPPQPQQPGMPNMKVIQNIIPFTMLFFFNSFSSGLSLYYFAANIVSIAQMLVIKRFFIDEAKIKAQIDNYAKTPRKKSSFQQRLEEMQAEQMRKTKELKSKKRR
ncbi:MAG: membrane protein insertase YidC [Crocinitomicaceae bacterium]|nr:membrane protein insertase YidC [Crocinitomicaceae bacterium]|tara:strand:- start:2920 stop:4770 length:1851 start_codon:yes stop_codon:yes gene_type:complete